MHRGQYVTQLLVAHTKQFTREESMVASVLLDNKVIMFYFPNWQSPSIIIV